MTVFLYAYIVRPGEFDPTVKTTVPAGGTITIVHDVSALFDFASVSAGSFSFESAFQTASTAQMISARGELTTIEATSNPITITVTNDVANRSLAVDRRATSMGTTASRNYSEGKTLASVASSYVTSRGASDSLYRAYFGATANSPSILNTVAAENSASRILSCVDSFGACTSGVILYTIYYCSLFFSEVPAANLCTGTSVASRNARGGTTLHELTHVVGGMDDIIYGCAEDQALSDANSVRNADNFNICSALLVCLKRCG
ncbi:hypothetical protein B0H13DRAFT_2374544 [Mycena leptocephala]|nr:hypothetical protein B0H13DRAFT_2374544 [Mycena leptocephala]